MSAPSRLDREETRVLDECDRESLLYRSLPLSATMFFGTQYAMATHRLSSKNKWLKLGGSVFLGGVIGKFSYAAACRRKILREIPESDLARFIRGETISSSVADQGSEEMIVAPAPDMHSLPVGVNQYGDLIHPTPRK